MDVIISCILLLSQLPNPVPHPSTSGTSGVPDTWCSNPLPRAYHPSSNQTDGSKASGGQEYTAPANRHCWLSDSHTAPFVCQQAPE